MNQPWTYSKDWFGTLAFWSLPATIRQREWSLWLDNSSSQTKTIKTFWAWGNLQLFIHLDWNIKLIHPIAHLN